MEGCCDGDDDDSCESKGAVLGMVVVDGQLKAGDVRGQAD
jgi:hypothetical protein